MYWSEFLEVLSHKSVQTLECLVEFVVGCCKDDAKVVGQSKALHT
jgi:hypothetical protein